MTTISTTWSMVNRASESLEVHLLGLLDFDSAMSLQSCLAYEISGREDKLGGLLICEHPPMITVGREGSRAQILADPRELISRQMEVRWMNRGGGCLVHAPGQLAVYPIVPLDRLDIGLAEYCELLEETAIDICRELKVSAYRRDDESGVWCRGGQIAHLGVAVKSWVSCHGLFINVCPSLDLMRLVKSNRIGERVTSLAAQRVRSTSMNAVRESLIRNLTARLGYDQFHLYTGHPLLKRTKQKVHVYA